MEKIRLGKTGMMVSKLGFGGAPLEKSSEEESIAVVKKCIDLGINFIDTAAEYHSEGRIGKAIAGQRDKVLISTRSDCLSREYVENNFQQSLKLLGTSYVDLYSFHGVSDIETYKRCIDPKGPLEYLQAAKKAGSIRHIGITTHSRSLGREAIKSGLFETVMIAVNFVYYQGAEELLPLARQHDVGFMIMKPLGAGRLVNIPVAFKFLSQYKDAITLVGLEKVHEIDEIMQVLQGPLEMTAAEKETMMKMRAAAAGIKQAFYLQD